MDIFDRKKRSEIMSKIRSENTKAEMIAFSYLRKNGVYFQRHYKKAPGSPDVASPRKKIAVFIDGDFWHGRNYEKLLEKHKDKNDYWTNKISRNIRRDKEQEAELSKLGWKVLRIWESDIVRKRTSNIALKNIAAFLKQINDSH